jgi:hypothetical protein
LRDIYRGVEVVRPIWEFIDRANSTESKSPLYQAFLADRFSEAISVRPMAWGAHFCPSGTEFLKSMRRATAGKRISSGDWFRPGQDAAMQEEIEQVLPSQSAFLQEARLNRALARSVKLAGGLRYAGYIQPDGKPHLIAEASIADALWGLGGFAPEQKAAKLFSVQSGGPDGPDFQVEAEAAPFSPLFYLRSDRSKIFEAAQEEAAIRNDSWGSIQVSELFKDLQSK